MNVIINTPDTDLPGGVAYFYKTIKPYFTSNVMYFTVGRRKNRTGKLNAVFQTVFDFINFLLIINTKNIDLIHINPSLGPKSFLRDAVFIALAKLSRKRVLIFFRGWDEEYERFSEKYLLWLYKLTYFRAEGIIVLAEQFKNKLIQLGYKGPIYVDTTVVGDDVFDGFSLDEKLYSSNEVKILFLSRIEKAKGIYELIDAINIINSNYNNVLLIVAGSGDEKDSVEKYAIKLGLNNIKFTGHIVGDEKRKVFKEADIFAFPTYYGEGMPNAVLEAMAYGLPVLTRPVGGLKDFFEDGAMGCLVEEVDANIYASRLIPLINDLELRRKVSFYNRAYSNDKFKASNVVKRLESVYTELLN